MESLCQAWGQAFGVSTLYYMAGRLMSILICIKNHQFLEEK